MNAMCKILVALLHSVLIAAAVLGVGAFLWLMVNLLKEIL